MLYLFSAAAAVLATALLGGCLGWAIASLSNRRGVFQAALGAVLGAIAGFILFEAGVVWERDNRGMSQVYWYGLSLYASQWASFGAAVLGPGVVALAILRKKAGGPSGS
jgi:hypothetical protein